MCQPFNVIRLSEQHRMTGGVDVNPARYGAERSKACGNPDDVRDAFDLALVAAARIVPATTSLASAR